MLRARGTVVLLALFVAVAAQCVAWCSAGMCAREQAPVQSHCSHHGKPKPQESGHPHSQQCAPARQFFARGASPVSPEAPQATGGMIAIAAQTAVLVEHAETAPLPAEASPPGPFVSSITILRT